MQIPIPNKHQIDKSTLLKIQAVGFKINAVGPATVVFHQEPTILQILENEFFEISDELINNIQYVQFKYIHKNAIKMGTWRSNNNSLLLKSKYMKIGIPETILLNLDKIQSLQLETIEIVESITKDYECFEVVIDRLMAVDFVDLDLKTYERCSKIQIRVCYKNNTTEIFKFNNKAQAIYKSKLLAGAQLCVRHKASEMFEDSDAGRFECLSQLNDKATAVCKLSKETKGNKNLIYYTIFFDKGYIELLNKSVLSILEQGKANFDLLLITDIETKSKIEQQPFVNKIKPKYLMVETPFDGVEASQNKTRVYEYKDIDIYDKILFLDCDIVCLKDVNNIFDEEIDHDTLYTAANTNLKWFHHKTFHHGFEFLGDDYVKEMTHAKQMPFNAGQFLFRNSDRMREHFKNVNWFMKNWAGEYFFEQAFLCYYFCKAYLTDDTVLNKYMSIISTTTTTEYDITEDTCLVHFIAPPLDANTKLKFIDFFLSEHFKNAKSNKQKKSFFSKLFKK